MRFVADANSLSRWGSGEKGEAGLISPWALVPGRPEEFTINLHQINHVFKRGIGLWSRGNLHGSR